MKCNNNLIKRRKSIVRLLINQVNSMLPGIYSDITVLLTHQHLQLVFHNQLLIKYVITLHLCAGRNYPTR
jgi:hypothetical protein